MSKVKLTPLNRLMAGNRSQIVQPGQIFQTTESQKEAHLVYRGFIKRYSIKNDGSISTQIVYGPGSIFSLTLILKELFNKEMYHGPEVFYYEAMGECEMYSIDMPKLIAAAKKDPRLHADLFQVACDHLNSCVHSLENLSLKTSYQRVAHQLLYFGWNFSEKTPDGVKLDLLMTHADLASMLSIARETVSRAMADLKKKGLIKTHQDSIIVPDMKKLEAAAYGLD